MKTLLLASLVAAGFVLNGCATRTPASHAKEDSSAYLALIRISAEVDGSDRLIFTRHSVKCEHKLWSPMTHVTMNGQPWTDLDHTPAGWRDLSRDLDLTRAWIVKRTGRDVIALERTAEGFELYLCDSPDGSAHYEATIAIPRQSLPPPAQ